MRSIRAVVRKRLRPPCIVLVAKEASVDGPSVDESMLHGRRRPWRAVRHSTLALSLTAAIGFAAFYEPPRRLMASPFAANEAAGSLVAPIPRAEPSLGAFGHSGAVQIQFALPGTLIEYPLQIFGDPTALHYTWQRLSDSTEVDLPRALVSDTLVAPPEAGFYRLVLVRDGFHRVLDRLTLAVMVPFDAKHGSVLDGYRIGTFPGERRRTEALPDGFVRVTPNVINLSITKHLHLADFLSRDGQTTWPRFAAVDPKVLDKLELVLERVASMRGGAAVADSARPQVLLSVHSAFRTPLYNRSVPRAARDSRHQYGDAVDVAIDADGDGRLTARDTRAVARAVEAVEKKYPDLVGGMGVYTGRSYSHPYVHIDARGERVRWHG
jgi:hypothetical protein